MACSISAPLAVRIHSFGAPLVRPAPVFSIRPNLERRVSSLDIWPWSPISAAMPISRLEAPGCAATEQES